MLDWLKPILKDSYSETVESEIAQTIGRLFVSRTDFNEVNREKKELRAISAAMKESIAEKDEEIERLKEYRFREESNRKNAAVFEMLGKTASARIKVMFRLLRLDEIQLLPDGSVCGLKEQIDDIKREYKRPNMDN